MPDKNTLTSILNFFIEAGANQPLDEKPHNRFAESIRLQPVQADTHSLQTQQQIISRPAPAIQDSLHDAREKADSAQSLDELLNCLHEFDGCALKHTATNLVFEDGSRDAQIMIVGEAPGRDEDLQGKPFVGRSGQLLDQMLHAIGYDRKSVYIANIIPWRPPGNRTPSPVEMELCKPFILRQITLVAPKILVFLGGTAAKNLLNTTDGILKLRGKWTNFTISQFPSAETDTLMHIPALPTLHPAYLLRQPIQKRLAWRDFQLLKYQAQKLDIPTANDCALI